MKADSDLTEAPAANTVSGQKKLSGLQRLCKLYGRMKCGDTMMVWDYVNDEAVPESEMPDGSERWRKSERFRGRQRV